MQKVGDTDDSGVSDRQDDLFLPSSSIRFDSQTLSDVSFGGPAVMAQLEALASEADPTTLLQKLCTSYDIVDLADSEPAMFEVGLKHILTAAVSAPVSAEAHFQRTFAIITSTIDGRVQYLHLTLKHLLSQEFRSAQIDLSGMPPLQSRWNAPVPLWRTQTTCRLHADASSF